jgi:hypothetical protein
MHDAQPVELAWKAFELELDPPQPDPPGLEPTPSEARRRGSET